jgi:hypothetical protein
MYYKLLLLLSELRALLARWFTPSIHTSIFTPCLPACLPHRSVSYPPISELLDDVIYLSVLCYN